MPNTLSAPYFKRLDGPVWVCYYLERPGMAQAVFKTEKTAIKYCNNAYSGGANNMTYAKGEFVDDNTIKLI